MEYEYDMDEPYAGRILWARLAVYGVAFVLVFLLGNCLGGRGKVPESEVVDLQQNIAELAEENKRLEDRVAALGADPQPAESPAPGETPTDEPDADATPDAQAASDGDEMRTYEVKSGDSLYGIAHKMYGDGSKYRLIVEENGLSADDPITVGQELRIPPDPDDD